MKYKIGDKFISKRNSTLTDMTPVLIKGKIYKITNINLSDQGYYIIKNTIFYSEEEREKYWNTIMIKSRASGKTGWAVGGLGPSHKIEDFFYTPKELRKLKLDAINNNR